MHMEICLAENDMINNCTNKVTHYLRERKAIAASLQLHEVNDNFGKGFQALKAHVLKAHVLNCLMRRCPHKSLQLQPKFHSLLKQRLLQNKKVTHRQTDRQSYCNPLTHAC